MKYITSKNPLKKLIVEALKKKTGASKVTCVQQVEKNIFRGNYRFGFTRGEGGIFRAWFFGPGRFPLGRASRNKIKPHGGH